MARNGAVTRQLVDRSMLEISSFAIACARRHITQIVVHRSSISGASLAYRAACDFVAIGSGLAFRDFSSQYGRRTSSVARR
jgi:hypothetical protein